MKRLLLFFTLFSSQLFAGIEQAPPSFTHNGEKAVWVDFITAHYDLKYYPKNKKALAVSTIQIDVVEEGYPIFDVVNTPSAVYLNGELVSQKLISTPENASYVRIALKKLPIGLHELQVHSQITDGVLFEGKRSSSWTKVSSAFFIRDLKGRKFLERYLPTNYEYDQYKMNMDVEVIGTNRWHSLFVNGKKTKITNNKYSVEFPDYYSSSSVFFHLVPINKFVRWYLTYPSIDGRDVPVTIYSNWSFMNRALKNKAWNVIKELEADYGSWPHDQVIIYGTGISGGMEYAGATETSVVSLGHELQHAYFAKGIHPANGNSGWLDEAIASWRDKGHQSYSSPNYTSFNLANHSVYTRQTDKNSYAKGRSFMAYINYQLIEAGRVGLKDFLRKYFAKRKFTTVTTEIFRADLEDYAQMSFDADFRQYIYGQSLKEVMFTSDEVEENPHHPVITDKQLQSIL